MLAGVYNNFSLGGMTVMASLLPHRLTAQFMCGQINIAESPDESARLNERRSRREAALIHDVVIDPRAKFS